MIFQKNCERQSNIRLRGRLPCSAQTRILDCLSLTVKEDLIFVFGVQYSVPLGLVILTTMFVSFPVLSADAEREQFTTWEEKQENYENQRAVILNLLPGIINSSITFRSCSAIF